jgi:hypothetical protein
VISKSRDAEQAEPGAGNFKEICPQCLFMQRLISPVFAEYCTAVQAGTALRHRDVLRRSKF